MPLVSMVLAFVLGAAVSEAPVPAEDVFPLASDPLLAALIAEAFEKNPDLKVSEQSLLAAQARISQASALPDPAFSLSYQYGGRGLRLGADEDTGLGVTASQGFPFPGKRRLARRIASKEAEGVGQSVERSRLSLVFRVRRAYSDLLLVRENLALIDDQGRATRTIEELTRSRYAVGLAGQSDVLRSQAELARLDQMRLHQEGLEVSAVAELNRLLARPSGTPIPPLRPLSALSVAEVRVPSVNEVVARAESRSPEIAATRLLVERSRAAVDLARRNLKPDFMASASYLNRGSLPGMWTVDLGVVAPFYAGRKQHQAVAEAEARLRSDEAALEAVRLRARAMAEKGLADFQAAVREAEAYLRGVLVVDGIAVESALASYQAGKVPFVSVLEAHNTRYKDRWEYADLLFHVLWHGASLGEYALGE